MNFRLRNLRKFMYANTQSIVISDRYRYTVKSNGNAVLQRYLSDKNNVIVPSIYDSYTVDDIGVFTYTGMTNIESITIPEGIIKIY